MKLTIEIPDPIMAELDTAIQKFNARAQAEIDEGRRGPGATLMEGTAQDILTREAKGWLRNFILNEHHLDLQQQTESLLVEEADKISKALEG